MVTASVPPCSVSVSSGNWEEEVAGASYGGQEPKMKIPTIKLWIPGICRNGFWGTTKLGSVPYRMEMPGIFDQWHDVWGQCLPYRGGWNRRGEQATGSFSDRCYATPLTLPTSYCLRPSLSEQPDLPAWTLVRVLFFFLCTQLSGEAHSTHNHRWYRRNSVRIPCWFLASTIRRIQLLLWGSMVEATYQNLGGVLYYCPVVKRLGITRFLKYQGAYTADGCSGTFYLYTIYSDQLRSKWYTSLSQVVPTQSLLIAMLLYSG